MVFNSNASRWIRFFILINEDKKEFDCWVVDLEPDKKKPPADKPAFQTVKTIGIKKLNFMRVKH